MLLNHCLPLGVITNSKNTIAGTPTIAKIMYVPKKGISKKRLNAIKLKFPIIFSFYRYLSFS